MLNQLNLFENHTIENPYYLKSQIITYIGNKRSLIPFIRKGFNYIRNELGINKLSILDLFSGSGVVSRMAKEFSYNIIANDIEQYSKVINDCYLDNIDNVDYEKLSIEHKLINERINRNLKPGFITELYAPKNENQINKNDRVFYTLENAIFLDSACRELRLLPYELRKYFLAPLLAEASIHVNTSGVFKGFYKNKHGVGQFGGNGKNALSRILKKITLPMPIFSNFKCDYTALQQDANYLVRNIDTVDVVYLDPPYNQHPYGSNYFMLNLLCSYKRPNYLSKVSGIPTNWNRSVFNKKNSAETALFDIIEKCRAKFVLISYNSEGFVSHQSFIKGLNKLGKLSIMDTKYNTFRGCRNLMNRDIHVTEFLYLLDKR